MSEPFVFILIFTGVWWLVGGIFLAIGIGMGRSWRRKEERLRAETDGTIVEVIRHASHSSDGTSVSWCPLVEFDYEGRRITLEGGTVPRKKYYEGQPVRVRYDPGDPTCFALDGDRENHTVAVVFRTVGALCIVVGAIAALVVALTDPRVAIELRFLRHRLSAPRR